MSEKILCIYHGACDDGFAAAWAVRDALGVNEVEFYPGVYQQPPPDVTGRDVVMVDFSYKRPVIQNIAASARSLLILDHHATANDDLSGMPTAPTNWTDWWVEIYDFPGKSAALFDMSRSGAGIAWDFFHQDETRPRFINYVEDRDLWLKTLPGGDEFTIALRSYPQNFETWDKMRLHEDSAVSSLIHEGSSIQRYYRARVDELKKSAYLARVSTIHDGKLPSWICGIANAPYFAASEVAGELCDMPDAEFGACYFEVSPGRWQYSLRSRGDFDVSMVALAFGGGGHKASAGFAVDRPVHTPMAWTAR